MRVLPGLHPGVRPEAFDRTTYSTYALGWRKNCFLGWKRALPDVGRVMGMPPLIAGGHGGPREDSVNQLRITDLAVLYLAGLGSAPI